MLVITITTAIAAILLYLPTIRYGFVWDDNLLITRNQFLQQASPRDLVVHGFWHGSPDPVEGPAASYYRPLTTFSFWFDRSLWGLRAAGFHFTNIVLNAVTVALVTLIIWELLHSGVWALIGGLLFLTHPAHVESVAFISGRTDLLAGMFVALASVALLRSLRKNDVRWNIVVIPAFILAILSKETAVVFPFLAAITPVLVSKRYNRWYWLPVIGMGLALLGYWLLREWLVPVQLIPPSPAPLGARLTEIANTAGLYVRTFFYPFTHRAKIPIDIGFLTPTSNAIIALLFVVTVPLIAIRRRFRAILWSYAWTLLFLLPVAGIVAIGPQAAERLLYIPSAGMVMIIVTLVSRLLAGRVRLRQLAAAGLVLVAIVFAVDAVLRSRIWQSDLTLFSAMVREAPRSPSAHANLADALAATNADSAIKLYNRAIMLDQRYTHAYINSAILFSRLGDHRQAIHNLRLAAELRPGSAMVLDNLAAAFLAAAMPESALATLDRIETGNPTLYVKRAAILEALNRPTAAESSLRRALSIDSLLPVARYGLASRFMRAGQADSAWKYMPKRSQNAREFASDWNRLGSLLVSQGDTGRGETCYRRALALDSNLVPALYNQAVLLLNRGDTASACRLIDRALLLRPDLVPLRNLQQQLTGTKETAR